MLLLPLMSDGKVTPLQKKDKTYQPNQDNLDGKIPKNLDITEPTKMRSWTTFSLDSPRKEEPHLDTRPVKNYL